MRNTLHHVSIAGDEIDVMVDDLLLSVEHRAHVRFGHSHADGVAYSLTERAGRGLHAGCVAVLGVAGCPAFPLPELLQVIEREIVAGEIEHAVQQHRCVSRRQHESIAVQPIRVGRIVAKVLGPEHVCEWRERHWCAGMAGVRFLNGVHRENSDRVDAKVFQRLAGSSGG